MLKLLRIMILLLFFAFASLKADNLFKGEGVINLPLPKYKGSMIYENSQVISIAAIDEKRLLVAWIGEREKIEGLIDEKEIEREAREKGGLIKSKKGEILETFNFLTIMDKYGRILSTSEDFEYKPSFGYGSFPLIMDETDFCPYAFISSNKLICYDFNLSKKKDLEIKISSIDDVKVSFDGKYHTLWIFGFSFDKENKTNSLEEYYNKKLEIPKKIGVKYIVEKGKFEELPVSYDEIFNEISKIAIDEAGEKIKINPSLIRLSVLSDIDNSDIFYLWIEAVESEKPESIFKYEGRKVFFKAEITPNGLGKIVQLHFWIIKQSDIKEEKLDKEKKVLYLPPFAKNENTTKAYLVGKNSILYHLRTAVLSPNEKGEYDFKEGLEVVSYFIFFPSEKSEPEFYSFYDEIWPQIKEDLSSEDFSATPMFGLYGRFSKYDFLFKGSCKKKDEKNICLIRTSLQK